MEWMRIINESTLPPAAPQPLAKREAAKWLPAAFLLLALDLFALWWGKG